MEFRGIAPGSSNIKITEDILTIISPDAILVPVDPAVKVGGMLYANVAADCDLDRTIFVRFKIIGVVVRPTLLP